MLDEKDRRALADIEQRLRADDPAFARRMNATTVRGSFPAIAVLCATVFLALPFVALFLGPKAALILIDLAAVAVVVILACRNIRGQDGRTGEKNQDGDGQE
ncbi:DUF3040 domain-containing protein [Actinoplanes sp. GCM10030250]|uniref:DUF3040 domain-containing protein n=1 Tax=Actinoplanes sp. GCM10030250 TaxID=3273376 RepID=UPI0036168A5E